MNRAEANVIRQAALFARDWADGAASTSERYGRAICVVMAVNGLVAYRKRHKKRAQRPVSTARRLRDLTQVSERA